MSAIPDSTALIQIEGTRSLSAVSESVTQAIGGGVNYAIHQIPILAATISANYAAILAIIAALPTNYSVSSPLNASAANGSSQTVTINGAYVSKHGRPVVVAAIAGDINGAVTNNTFVGGTATATIRRNGSDIRTLLAINNPAGTPVTETQDHQYDLTPYFGVDFPAAGTWNYELHLTTTGSSSAVAAVNVQVFIIEL